MIIVTIIFIAASALAYYEGFRRGKNQGQSLSIDIVCDIIREMPPQAKKDFLVGCDVAKFKYLEYLVDDKGFRK